MRATLLTLIGLAAAACGLILAPAGIASAAESADLTIAILEAQGFDVKVNRIGSAPLNQCVVTDVRNPRERTEFVPVIGGVTTAIRARRGGPQHHRHSELLAR